MLPILPPEFNFKTVEILEKSLHANIALSELNGLIMSLPNKSLILLPLTAKEAVSSSGIENIFSTTLDILQNEIFGDEAKVDSAIKETLRYKEALFKGFQLVEDKKIITTNDIINIHSAIEPNKQGIRKLPGTVIAKSDGSIVHTPPQSELEIRSLLANLEKYINDSSFSNNIDPLVRLAVSHYQFESIHPFYDGNGRTGRILMILELVLSGRLNFPCLFLSDYILKNKNQYYTGLQALRLDNNWTGWVLYILDAIEIQSKETSKKVRQIIKLKEEFSSQIKLQLPKLASFDVLEYFFSNAFYTVNTLSNKMNITIKTARNYLKTLENQHILEQNTVKNQKLYFIPDLIDILK
jgi:Fic family protein